jgi:hypothetical protein
LAGGAERILAIVDSGDGRGDQSLPRADRRAQPGPPAGDELVATWNLWLEQAQATNDLDAHLYSHGVFEREPENATRSGDRAIDVRTGRVPQTGGGKGNGVSGA